jgi:hypothetical protein
VTGPVIIDRRCSPWVGKARERRGASRPVYEDRRGVGGTFGLRELPRDWFGSSPRA